MFWVAWFYLCILFVWCLGFFFGFPFYKEHGVVLIIAHSLPTSYLTCLVAQSNLLPYKVSGYFKSILYKSKDFLKVLPIWLLNDDVTLCQDWWRSSCFLKWLQVLCAHGLGKLCSLLCPNSYVYGNLCGVSSLFWSLSEWRAAVAVLCGHQIHCDGANDGWLSVRCPYCNPLQDRCEVHIGSCMGLLAFYLVWAVIKWVGTAQTKEEYSKGLIKELFLIVADANIF